MRQSSHLALSKKVKYISQNVKLLVESGLEQVLHFHCLVIPHVTSGAVLQKALTIRK